MCGISGINSFGSLTDAEFEKFRELIIRNTFRGWDSTGVFDWTDLAEYEVRDEGKKPCMYWKSMKPGLHWATDDFDALREKDARWAKDRPSLAVAHCRAATRGAVTLDNCHPFTFQNAHANLIGVHNGTINGQFEKSNDFQTDSEALYWNIADKGLSEALNAIKQKAFNVAYALAYLDLNAETLNLIRNKERPLHILNDGGCGYFSSDWKDLLCTFPSASMDATKFDWVKAVNEGKGSIPVNTILSLPENVLFTVQAGDAFKDVKLTKIEVKEKVYPAYNSRGGQGAAPFTETTKRAGSYGNTNTVSDKNQPPVMRHHWYRKLEDFETFGAVSATITANCYAPELDLWLSRTNMESLLLWRLMNKTEFLTELTKLKNACKSQKDFNDALDDGGFTRGDYKRFCKGDFVKLNACKFVVFSQQQRSVFVHGPLSSWYAVHGDDFKKHYDKHMELNTTFGKGKTEQKVLPFQPKTETISYGTLNRQYSTTFSELEALKDCGCFMCKAAPIVGESLFWLDRKTFLCEQDQLMIVDSADKYKTNLLPTQSLLDELRSFTVQWTKETLQNIRKVH